MKDERSTFRPGDAKAYFASERTFLHWLSVAVTTGSLAAGLLGISGHAHRKWDVKYERAAIATRVLGLLVLAVSIILACMASCNFKTRGEKLRHLSDGPYDTRWLPLFASVTMLFVLVAVWISSILTFVKD